MGRNSGGSAAAGRAGRKPGGDAGVPLRGKGRRRLSPWQIRESAVAIGFFFPFAVLFTLFVLLPVGMSFYYSLTTFSVVQEPLFVGLQNYKYLFTEDDTFLKAMANTFVFSILSGVLGYALSFVVAWALNTVRLKTVYALAFYAPSITSGIAMSVVWLYFFSPDSAGLINNFLLMNGFIDKPLLWTQDPDLIVWVVTIVSVWMGMGTGFLGFLAGFQNLPSDVFEAGRIDGIQNPFQELIYLILPLMKPMLLFGAINSVASAFSIYDVPLTLIGSPGPENASLTLVGHINDYAFTRLDMGYANTVAVFLFAVTFLIGRGFFHLLGSKDD